jgi:hypothetical protein
VVKLDRWKSEKCSEKCGKVLKELGDTINVAMVFVPKLVAVCPTLVLVLFGCCGRINGEGRCLQLAGVCKDFEMKSPQRTSQKPERIRLLIENKPRCRWTDNIKISSK